MFPFRFYTAFDVLSDLEKLSQESYKEPKKTIGNQINFIKTIFQN